MSDNATIRERIQRASAYFHRKEGVVMTTFNLNGEFFEEQALPIVLGVEAKTLAARRAETHQRLGATPCTVFYSPVSPPKISGRYRFVARPVPLRGRCFHPKIVVIAGRSSDETTWVYLAVSSANLSLSGWGRNAESFGETWIHTRQQQSWQALDGLLEWLQSHGPLGDAPGDADAVLRVRAALARMPDIAPFPNDDTSPWSGTLEARLYSSVSHPDGFANFLRLGHAARPSKLVAYSPYWSDVAAQAAAFDAEETVLFPALCADGSSLGLARTQVKDLPENVEVRQNAADIGKRFWHMKTYWILHGDTAFTAVGSCNFSHPGLSGRGGNVEAALVFEADPDWLPSGDIADPSRLAAEPIAEDELPPLPTVLVIVAFDWGADIWRIWLDAEAGDRDFVLHLPEFEPVNTSRGTHEFSGPAPPRGATYVLQYVNADGEHRLEGQIVEVGLDLSKRVYGRPLTASEILDSWRGRAATWDLGGGGADGDADTDGADTKREIPAAFDAVNLYDLYRSMRALQVKLASLDSHPEIQRSLLVGRPDSVMALAQLADHDDEAPIIRYLVLRELFGVMNKWPHVLDRNIINSATQMAAAARLRTIQRLESELDGDAAKARDMLDWFEVRLAEMDEGNS
jgi:hypothetical protein